MKVELRNDNLSEIKADFKRKKFVLFVTGAYMTKTGSSPKKSDAEVYNSNFFRSDFCKLLLKDGGAYLESI